MYYRDLSTHCQIARGAAIRAIGWLDAQHEYPRGVVPPEVVDKLGMFAVLWGKSTRALEWAAALGYHTCELCGMFRGAGNFGVPGDGVLYACPELIAHYVRDHAYRPPDEFVHAVLASPFPGTPEYARAVEAFRSVNRSG